MSINDSPLTVDDTEWDEDTVSDFLFARVLLTDAEWDAEGEHEWDISREDAATRIDAGDFSPPDWYHAPDED